MTRRQGSGKLTPYVSVTGPEAGDAHVLGVSGPSVTSGESGPVDSSVFGCSPSSGDGDSDASGPSELEHATPERRRDDRLAHEHAR